MNFIDYHLELEEPYNNLPKINYKFLSNATKTYYIR